MGYLFLPLLFYAFLVVYLLLQFTWLHGEAWRGLMKRAKDSLRPNKSFPCQWESSKPAERWKTANISCFAHFNHSPLLLLTLDHLFRKRSPTLKAEAIRSCTWHLITRRIFIAWMSQYLPEALTLVMVLRRPSAKGGISHAGWPAGSPSVPSHFLLLEKSWTGSQIRLALATRGMNMEVCLGGSTGLRSSFPLLSITTGAIVVWQVLHLDSGNNLECADLVRVPGQVRQPLADAGSILSAEPLPYWIRDTLPLPLGHLCQMGLTRLVKWLPLVCLNFPSRNADSLSCARALLAKRKSKQ